ncbi:protein-disulfide reductase DsbD family protein [Fibrella aquatilis]|uniref:Thioredoxin family protein n=1 Tax=Fibrella aquatilis TaxID=2817059 RepID=A0A939G560_9BACT|nr:thioredoxin family protein [Fibrella aquatilis]MBO0932314.1 thioredoxin family protein [Fibrella aquatilis]
MIHRLLLLALLGLFLLPTTTNAQFGQGGGIRKTTFSYAVSPTKAKVGDVVELRITVRAPEGFHAYAAKTNPKIDGGPQPTVLTLAKNKTIEAVGSLVSVNYETKYSDIWEGDEYIMPNPAVFVQKVKLLSAKPVLKGTIEGQVCKENCVLFNDDFDLSAKLTVLTAATATAPVAKTTTTAKPTAVASASAARQTDVATTTTTGTETALTAATEAVVGSATAATQTAATAPVVGVPAAPESLWRFVLAAFLAGLAALLTPCVFPIIPMTVSFFTNQKGGKWKALVYGASIIGIYVLIGTVVSRINGPGFANFVSTHWLPNLLFFAVFFIFGLSFLGLFEITLPSSLVNKADSASERGGLAGIFFMAFTLVLVSFSCTGPIVGSLLVASAGGAVVKPIIGMAAFSSAFAIPFTLFALFPQWLQKLPKSGGWLNAVKVVLGFIELALALKFLSIADQVYHWHLLDREVYLAFWIVIFALLGFYLLGKLRLPHDNAPVSTGKLNLKEFAIRGVMNQPVMASGEVEAAGQLTLTGTPTSGTVQLTGGSDTKVSIPRLLLAIITFTFVVYMVPGMWGAPLNALAGYLPPLTSQDFSLQAGGGTQQAGIVGSQMSGKKHADLFKLPLGLQGFFDYKEALAYAKTVNKPVFIDFTGHGCVNCREMEQRVWSDPRVLSRLQNDYVLVALYVDDKTELPEADWYTSSYDQKVKKTIGAQNADLQITKYNNNAQPHYCLVDGSGNLLITPTNYNLDIDQFTAFMDAGKAAFKK